MTTTDHPINYPFPGGGTDDYVALNPSAERAGLADSEPLVRVRLPYGGDAWLARRYEDVKLVLGDTRFSRAAAFGKDVPRSFPVIREDKTLLDMDPPDHTRLRRLATKAFTSKRVETLRPRVHQIVNTLFDEMIAKGAPADLMSSVSWPLPITVICEMLGVPYEDREKFRAWTDASLAISAFTPEEIEQATRNLTDYMAGLLRQRRENPKDDLLTALMQAQDNDDRLDPDEVVQLAAALLVGGHETTANQFGNFVFSLFDHPEELAKLRANPDTVNAAVEELLRHTPLSASGGFVRIATENVEVGGTTVRAGEGVFADVVAANRDPRRFDDGQELKLDREPIGHIAFGHGVHHCIGAQLARMELQVALGTLIRRFPDLSLAVDAQDAPWKHGRLVRGLQELPVTWSEVRE
ncbi:cytochrome P450 [Kibdelosporangium philippinense]|uniref:Cytochrome P450 n=1 Tax=Kibdelosporangium philippinense TaxID=211113 RepID=A0ABS8ZXS4_9PSEU|nr:cytochrome P450 [Kibdelosporangium philippinense]MCE7011561.1 cytochrome P450 [Kibdelosporangium philippinense]